ncbi:predicted protein [Lichtheimia corymbifera JMRC:FSU:9682]|uniref:Uncharacterized protein n=1 Tax=Lichtheimia corymbifera JMRC:FSU:9682 TaxID=1263082 RepID=A0A068SF75_9FUNG|nr:predicted protein [Lichtheimia corymbifera JMRC:FSU:9682]
MSQTFDLFWSRLLANCFQEHSAVHVSYGCRRATSNDSHVSFWSYQGLSIAEGIRRQVSPPSLEIHCSSAKMDGMEIRFLFDGRALLRSSARIKKAFPWLYHWSLGYFLCVHLQQAATTSIFRCRQGLSRSIVVLAVDNSFDGYSATHAYYRWLISATSTRSSNNVQQNPYL